MDRNSSYAQRMNALPMCSADDLVEQRDVLVIAPHPDDESLGCGGILSWATAKGRHPRVLFLTDGDRSHPGSTRFPRERLAAVRRQEAVTACNALGMDSGDLTFLGLPDAGLAQLEESLKREAIGTMARWIELSQSAIVLVTAATDPHGDHQSAYALAKDATRQNTCVELWTYPVWTWLHDIPIETMPPSGWRVDIHAFQHAKREAIHAHASQHGAVVDDAQDSFVLPPALLQQMSQDYEVFLHADL